MDHDSIMQDALEDISREKYIKENDLIYKTEAEDYASEEFFIEKCKKVIDDYNIKDYINKIDKWKILLNKEKLEYCYDLLTKDPVDEFPIFRQIDVFQKLVNLDFEKFNYYRVLECAFFNEDYQGVNKSKTFDIQFNPLIPQKLYTTYMNQLRKDSKIKYLQLPTEEEDVLTYLKETLYFWYLYHYEKKTPYQIQNFQQGDVYIDKTQIARRIKAVEKLTM